MLKSYLKTTLRTIRRSPLSSFINIFGLAMAMGVAILVYAFVDMDLTTDQFHENREEIYLATSVLNRNGDEAVYGITPVPFAERLINDFPQIKQVVRVERRSGILKSGMNVFNERFTFTDPEFLDMFTFPLKWGDKSVLNEPNKIVLSENTAIKYFGDENPVGQAMTFEFGERKYTFEVGGVLEKFPYKNSFRFGVLVNYDQLRQVDTNFSLSNWAQFLDAAFIRVDDPSSIQNLTANVQQYVDLQNAVQEDWPATSFGFKAWTRLYTDGVDMRNIITGEADPIARLVLTIVGVFVLVLAVFNYVNIAITSATKRLKEIGVRKVMGGTRSALVFQFLTENIVLTLGALIFGFVLAITVLIPGFDEMFDVGMDFTVTQPELWIFLVVLAIFTGLASGAYPALYISNFSAVNIFRGRLRFGGKNRMTKVFLTFQYILACIAIVGGIMFTQNTTYQKNRDWGYNETTTISTYVSNDLELKQLMNAMQGKTGIKKIAASQSHVGRSTYMTIIETLERKIDVPTLAVGPDYVETMGLELVEGRSFDKSRAGDNRNVLVNEKLARNLNPNGVLGEQFKIDSLTYTVVGVIKDFHQWSFFDEIDPMLIRLAPEENYRYLSLEAEEGALNSTYETLQSTWADLFPEKPFDGFYQEATLDWYFRQIEGHGRFMQYVATLCMVLSCLGLYGLVSLNVASRTKEFSIRKALGARLKNLVVVINRQFVLFMAIALVLGLPLSYVMMEALMSEVYAYYKPITAVPFLIALFFVIMMVFVTVSSQVRKIMSSNPTEGLRSE